MKSSTTVSHWFAHRAVPAIVSVIGVAFIVMAGFLIQIGTTLDRTSAERAGALVESALDAQRQEMRRTIRDYAAWGEAYRNLHPVANVSWAYDAANAGPTLFSDFGLNFVIVIGPSGATSYAVVDGQLSDQDAKTLLQGGLASLADEARKAGPDTVPVDGILMADGVPVLTAAAVLSPGKDPRVSNVPGPSSVLVLGYSLTAEKLAALGHRVFVTDLHQNIAAVDNGPARKTLSSVDGQHFAVLEWTPEHAGATLLNRVLPWLGGAAALLALLTYLVLRQALRSARLLDRSARQLATAHAKAEHLAMHDIVTGLANRAMLKDHLDDVLAQHAGECTALLFLDLDRFKPVNDALGHHAGDQVLIELALRLKSVVRDGDIVARVGGDEFVVAATTPDRADVEPLCRRLCEVIARPFTVENNEVQIGVSIGVALAPQDAGTSDELIRRADIAMYQAKNDRQGYRFYSAEMNEQVLARRELELDLRHAMGNDEFELHFQPRFETSTCRITGVEALLRWRHPRRGLVPPADFIPLAEETGLVTTIGGWVLREACTTIARHADIGVAVNLSPVQFRSDLVSTVRQALEASGLAPERLELELTEGVLLENSDSAVNTLQQLKELGVGLAMDDFGTGYSSLNYLQAFPFDRIKIDRSFVSQLNAKGGSRPIVQAILGLGRALGMTVTAEGVETLEQFLILRADQCSEIQGYLLSRPLPVAALEDVLGKSPDEIRRSIAA